VHIRFFVRWLSIIFTNLGASHQQCLGLWAAPTHTLSVSILSSFQSSCEDQRRSRDRAMSWRRGSAKIPDRALLERAMTREAMGVVAEIGYSLIRFFCLPLSPLPFVHRRGSQEMFLFGSGIWMWHPRHWSSRIIRFLLEALTLEVCGCVPRGHRWHGLIQVADCRFSRWAESEVWLCGSWLLILFNFVSWSSMVGEVHILFFILNSSTRREITWVPACQCVCGATSSW
jgi:hypothetical protein